MKQKNEKIKLDIQMFADGEIQFKVDLDTKDAEGGASRLGSIGKSVFKGLALGIGTATTALGGLVAKSVELAGELEQNVGGSEAVFKELGDSIDKMTMKTQTYNKATGKMEESISNLQDVSTNAYKNMGLSQSEYLATLNKMGALMQGSGIKTQESLNLSAQAMQRAADVASIMGIDIESAMESVAGAAKGNFTMMDNLGVAMNATTIEAYALSKGVKKSFDEMTKAEQVGYAMEMFLDKTSYATGNYAKENETFAGSFQTLKASITNFMSGAGDMEAVLESLFSFIDILVENVGNMAPKIIEGIIQLVNGVAVQLPTILQQLLPSLINGAVMLIQGLVTALPTLIPVLMQGIVQAFTSIAEILPQLLDALLQATIFLIQELANQLPVLIPTLIDAILGLIPVLLDNLPLFVDAGIQLIIGLATGLVDAIPQLLERLPEIIESLITGLLTALPKILSVAPQMIITLAKGLIKAIPSLVKSIPQIITAIVNGLKQGITNMLDIGKNLVQGLWNGIKNAKDWVLDKIKGFGKSVLNGIKDIFGINSPSKVMFEIGGYLDEGFINGIDDMEKDINKQIDSTFGSGLEYLYDGYDNFSLNVPETSSVGSNQIIYLNNSNSNSSRLEVDGKVLAEVVNNFNFEREVAV